MRHLRSWALLPLCATALLVGCAVPPAQPDPEVAQLPIPEPSMQKCATSTGSRLATTCSNMVKSTANRDAIKELQRHMPMEKSN